MEILGLSGGGLARSFVGGTPGRQILRDSLKRKCNILVSPGPEVILENLGLSGVAWAWIDPGGAILTIVLAFSDMGSSSSR